MKPAPATARYPDFMPHVKTARTLRPSGVEGGRIVYTRVSLPLVSDRDFVPVHTCLSCSTFSSSWCCRCRRSRWSSAVAMASATSLTRRKGLGR